MIRVFVRHTVEDLETWRTTYHNFVGTQKNMDVEGEGAYQNLDKPNEVTVWHDFDTLEEAKEFFESPVLKEAMAEAGVTSAPEIWFTKEI